MSMEAGIWSPSEQRTVAIVGLGYVGLPLALLFAERGFHVLGIDSDKQKIDKLSIGKSYILEVQDDEIQAAIASKRFVPSDQYSELGSAEAVMICVPTPLTAYGTPDLSFLTQAAREIGCRLRKGQLVVLESSTYPGTTREVLLPLLSAFDWKIGEDVNLAYSPERVDPGNTDYRVAQIPKVVSGITPSCLSRIVELYSGVFNQVHSVSSTDAAEMTKLLENSYRLVNISFINELAMICDVLELNLWEIIEAANTKPFGFKAFYPGPGVGGHCIPVDPSYLAWKIKQYGIKSDFIQISNTVNRIMPMYITQQLKLHLAPKLLSSARILVYGAAYKRDIADHRESASIELIHMLQLEAECVMYHDPYVPSIQVGGEKLMSVELDEAVLSGLDCVVIATDHSSLPLQMLLEHASFIYDTRNVTGGAEGKAKVVRFGGGWS
ncbi:UDP-N-acetyl-D-glucosamine dehydrogenase [Paenibacillus sp. FSL H8-0548]|uniref:nucleotide sugar dehydrogenase n=1 Tax=Paenibacillus sp. FSL H8-0548 TaxID=1920422 RepID=UPI00096E9135|nr:nucleotide sugar dehydrogenase [Paenibacillus sp. FSL H8-0548]OMF31788.1 UDP-N-acetyl-D-glucosamine dehydrogenase [Paenibacillus sp. FSL H8-0548]